MPNITFVYPDFESVGVADLMSLCRSEGYDVDLVYYEAEDAYLGRAEALLSAGIADRIIATNPSIVAFSCVTDNYQHQLACAQALKEKSPDTLTLFGGVHPTAVPEQVLQQNAVDAVAVGEGEISFMSFLSSCRFTDNVELPSQPIKGITYKKSGNVIGAFEAGEIADIENLPFPYKEPFYAARKTFSREYFIMTSRGCPYSCTYCFNSSLTASKQHRKVRQRSVNSVIGELVWAKKTYGMKYVYFLDDAFAFRDEWLFEFCKRYQAEIGLPFACISIPFYITREKARALSQAGCVHMEIGIQSLTQKLCTDVIRRRSDNTRTAEVIGILKQEGIVVQVDHMLGIPGDTIEEEEKGALLYNEWRPNIISVFWLTYYPKTKIIEMAKEMGVLSDKDEQALNRGERLTSHTFHTGGSMKDPSPYFKICTLLNYLPLMPKWLVRLLVKKRLYRLTCTKGYHLSIALPRLLLSLLNRKNFRDRIYISRFLEKLMSRAT